jgi:Tfp pilus assembly pilus retraction ATPase PilT
MFRLVSEGGEISGMKIEDLLRFMCAQQASDLHLKPMRPPLIRLKGKLLPLKADPLQPDLIREMLSSVLTEKHEKTLEEKQSADFG